MATEQPATGAVDFGTSTPFWRDERVIRISGQVISAALVIGFLIWTIINFFAAAEARGLSLSFAFLDDPAGFPISDPAIPYDPSDTFGYAFLVGLLNTIRVSAIGILFATILGTLVGLARMSTNWLVSKIALVYIEIHRNIPLLVLIFLWYFAVFNQLPPIRNAIRWPGPAYLSQRGLYLTWARISPTGQIFLWTLLLGIALSVIAWTVLRRRRELTGQETYFGAVSAAILILLPTAGWFLSGGSPLELDTPTLQGFNFQGGLRMTPELAALLVSLTMYTAGFIAEVVRAGVQAVDRGQLEAARAVGLNNFQILGLVILPQALRIIIPPMISQYLNLTKNSSLALLIGYQDLFGVSKIAINQSGREVPVFLMVMGTYLSLSLLTSIVLNFYNRRIQLVER